MSKNIMDVMPNLWGDSLPYLQYIPEVEGFLLDDGALMCTFVCQPLNGVNQEVQNALEDLFKNDFPTDMFVQMSMFASPDIRWMLDAYEQNRGHRNKDPEISDLLDGVARDNVEFLTNKTMDPLTERGEVVIRDFEVWVTMTLPLREMNPSSKELDVFLRKQTALKGTLEAIHLQPHTMNSADFLHRMKVMHNWGPNASWRKHPGRHDASKLVRDQILDQGRQIKVHQDGIELGNTEDDSMKKEGKFVKFLSVKHYPRTMTFGQLYSLVVDWQKGQSGIKCPFFMTLNIHYPNQLSAKDKFTKNRTYMSHMASTVFAKWVEKIVWQKEDYDTMHQQIEKYNAQITNAYLQIMLFCDNRSDGERVAQLVASHGARTGWALQEDNYFCMPFFKAALPGGLSLDSMKKLNRFSVFPSNVLKHLCPIVSAWKGNGFKKPIYPMVTREGQLFMWDPFTSDGNFNIAVAAASGSGKSFWVNGLFTNILSSGSERNPQGLFYDSEDPNRPLHSTSVHDGGRVFVIDVGRSYEKIVEMAGGRFVVFDDNFQYSLNPFKTIHEFGGSEGQADMLISLVSYMAAPESALCQYQKSTLTNIITAIWFDKGNNGRIDDVKASCDAHEDKRIKDLGVQLTRWTAEGDYGEYFRDDKPPIDFDGHFIVFELEELKAKKVLQRAVLLQCIASIQHEMFLTGKEKRKVFGLDEAWEFLSDDDGGSEHIKSFLEAGWRRFRKYNASGIAISQSLMDYYKSSVGEAIIANSQWKVLLRQEPEQVEQAKATGKFAGGDQEFELLKSLHTRKGEYSEIYIRGSSGAQVVRLYVPRYQQLMFTTDPDELKMIDKFRKSGLMIRQAIEMTLENEGHGSRNVAAAKKTKMTGNDIVSRINAIH
ncbi:TraC family protein [Vibrio sp. Makdt]|uniref:TraC family protein n=1 Tax=Vibrio sp. Makdt TaxID=2998828 RepID=UPI0022CD2175|nr:TraC family protein [Vibrio sp. Makdt]MDA0152465.1 TraC family protein [Vibrio sp. Makdt]